MEPIDQLDGKATVDSEESVSDDISFRCLVAGLLAMLGALVMRIVVTPGMSDLEIVMAELFKTGAVLASAYLLYAMGRLLIRQINPATLRLEWWNTGKLVRRATVGLFSFIVGTMLVWSAQQDLSFILHARSHSRPASCISNLRTIDMAKQQWALENRKTSSDIPTFSEIAHYLNRNVPPVCPLSGSYTLNAVSADPTCTKAAFGHTL